nr:ribonuclease H-like domain-containing protein [Tanacetum cinerariifolium]
MVLPDKHQLKFNIHKDVKTLMEAIEKQFGGNKETKKVHKTLLKQQYKNFTGSSSKSLDQIHDRLQKLIRQLKILGESLSQEDINLNLKIYETEVKSSSSTGTTTQNIDFVSSQNTDSTNELVSVVASVSSASKQVPVSDLSNVDTLSDAVIYSFFANGHVDYERKEVSSEDMNFQAEEEPTNYALMTFTSSSSSSSDNEVASCSKACLDSVEARLLVYQQNETVFEEDIKLLKLDVELRDNALIALRKKFEMAKQERDELKLKLEKFQTSSKNLSQLLASQTNDKTGLGYNNQVFNSSVFDCDEMFSSAFDISLSASLLYDRYKSREGYHAVPPLYTGTFMPPKPDLVFHDAPTINVELSPTKPDKDLSQSTRPFAPLIEHWVSNSKDDSEVEHPILANNLRKDIPKSRGHSNSRNKKACFVCKSLTHLIKDCDDYEKKMDNPQHALKDKGVIDSGCSRHMIGNMSYLSDFKEINGGYVAFGGNPKGGMITSKGKIKTGKLNFDDVYFVKELKFNLFSVSQMCDKKNIVLFTDTECIVLSSDFKLPDENHVLLRVLRENNMYNVDLKNIVPSGGLTYLFAKATLDESKLWHKRLGHINFKIMNKLVKGNLVRGLPSKVFENNHACVACKKGKQHRASCKTKPVSSVSQPLQRLHMDLFGPTFVKSLNKKSYCLVVTDDYSRFSWVFLLATKDETSPILKTFITDIENQLSLKAEAANTACYVQNRVLVTKPHIKTPYELLLGRTPSVGFMRLFGCPVTILNTLDPLGKFDGKADKGFFLRYFVSSKAYRVFNSRTRIVQETLHINFLENQPNVTGSSPTWLFDIDTLTNFMNYQPVITGNQPNPSGGIQEHFDADKAREGNVQQYVLFPLWSYGSKDPQNTNDDATFEVQKPKSNIHVSLSSSAKTKKHDDKTNKEAKGKSHVELSTGFRNLSKEFEDFSDNNTNEVNAASTPVPAVGQISTDSTNIFSAAGPSTTAVSLTLENLHMWILLNTLMIKIYQLWKTLLILMMKKMLVQRLTFLTWKQLSLTQKGTPSWIKAMQEELLQFKMQKVWVLVDLPKVKRAIGSKWVFRNKKDERGFEDPDYPDKVYKVIKALYGLHQALRACYETLANYHLENGFHRGQIDQTLFIKKPKDGKLASTPIDTEKPLLKDPDDDDDVDVHTYRSMIGSLMYLTSSRPDIMFAVCTVVATSLTEAEYVAAVIQSSMKLLERTFHVTNVSSAG